MNTAQRTVIKIGITLILLFGLFPYGYSDLSPYDTRYQRVSGYHFILSNSYDFIDWSRLILIWALVVITSTGLVLLYHKSTESE